MDRTGLEKVKIFESINVGRLTFPLWLVNDSPLLGWDGLQVSDGPEAPNKPQDSKKSPDEAHGVESLLDGETVAPLLLALVHHDGAEAGVVALGPGGPDGSEVGSELQWTEDVLLFLFTLSEIF